MAVISTDKVEHILAHLVTSVLDRLVEQGVQGTPLEKEWGALASLGADEREYCVASARLGLDPFAEADEFEAEIIGAAQQLPREILGEFFEAVDPDRIPRIVEWITGATRQAERLAGAPSDEIRLAREALTGISAPTGDVPWRLGWQQAQVVRSSLGLTEESPIDIGSLVPLEWQAGVDPHVQAVGVAPPGYFGRPAIVLGRPLHASSKRFIQGRALWRRVAREESTFLITTSYTDLQKVERAFSAELLAPAEGIKRKLDVPPDEAIQEDLDQVADHFGVSPVVIEHQIENQILNGRRPITIPVA